MASIVISPSIAKGNGVVKKPRVYQCSTCGRTFKRSEHCIRHERGHTSSKPFPCKFCGRYYARKDLVTRHVQSFHPNGNAERIQNETLHSPRPTLSSSNGSPQDTTIQLEDKDSSSATGNNNARSLERESSMPIELRDQSVTLIMPNDDINLESQSIINRHSNVSPILQRNVEGSQDSEDLGDRGSASVQSPPFQQPIRSDQNSHSNRRTSGNNQTPLPHEIPPDLIDPQLSEQWQPDNIFNVGNYSIPTVETSSTKNAGVGMLFSPAQSRDMDFFGILSSGTPQFDMDYSVLNGQLEYENNMTHPTWGNLDSIPTGMPLLEDTTSPTRSGTGQISETDHRAKMFGSESGREPIIPIIDEDTYADLQADIKRRLPSDMIFQLPSALKLQQFIKCYFSNFHSHFPILHLPTLIKKPLYTPLILAISAIGALYRLRRGVARDLWLYARSMLEPECRRYDLHSRVPIQALQGKLLLTIFAAFGGNVADYIVSTENVGFWTTEYRLRRSDLDVNSQDLSSLSWEEWCTRETTKRLLCGIFILSSMLTVTYDTTPFLSVTQDLNIDVPEPEQNWKAMTAEQWEQVSYTRRNISLPTIREVLCHLTFENSPSYNVVFHDRSVWSGFATTVVMHAVNIHMWHIMQCTQSFTGFPIDQATLGHSMVLEIEQALTRCYTLLTTHQSEKDLTSDSGEGPEIFNCQALLRSAYVRIFTGVGSFDRMMLLSDNEDQIASRIDQYIQAPQRRNPFLTKAVSKAYGGLLLPITAGFLLVKRTAALTWSVEHAIAAWDCALFVTKWIHGIETNQSTPSGPLEEDETENLTNFRNVLSDLDSDYEGTGSLAADVAHIWAEFLDDTWVWGITPKMGSILRLLSKAYVEDRRVKLNL